MQFKRRSINQVGHLPCLVCGVDSGPVLTFFLWLVGLVLLASLSVFLWGLATGKFSTDEATAQIPLDVERDVK